MRIDLKKMIPFLGREDFTELIGLIKGTEDYNYKGITFTEILPFLSHEQVDELFFELAESGQDISSFYPFLSKNAYCTIVDEIINGNSKFDADALYAFLPDNELHRLFVFAVQNAET